MSEIQEMRFEDKWLIWSVEHRCWWKPNSFGYTANREDAGRYSLEEAKEIVRNANKWSPWFPDDSMVPE